MANAMRTQGREIPCIHPHLQGQRSAVALKHSLDGLANMSHNTSHKVNLWSEQFSQVFELYG